MMILTMMTMIGGLQRTAPGLTTVTTAAFAIARARTTDSCAGRTTTTTARWVSRTSTSLDSRRRRNCYRSSSSSEQQQPSSSSSFSPSLPRTAGAASVTTLHRGGLPPPLRLLDPLVVCGPSGVGKGAIIAKFMDLLPLPALRDDDDDGGKRQWLSFAFAVSHTTRPPRPGEIDGVHYHFVPSPLEMQRLIGRHDVDAAGGAEQSSSFFVEHATVHGHEYGTSWAALQAVHGGSTTTTDTNTATANDTVVVRALLDIDVQGVKRLKAIQKQQQQHQQLDPASLPSSSSSSSVPFLLQPRYIFIAPPDLDTLRRRLLARGTETASSIAQRTANAASELAYGLATDSDGGIQNFDAVVINADLDQAVADFAAAVDRLYRGAP